MPELAATLAEPEPLDVADGVAILLAESKGDGDPLGSLRIQTNAFEPLLVEQSIELPLWLRTQRLAEATRLGVVRHALGPVVKLALFKACYDYCRAAGVTWMVVAARSPIDRQYQALLFDDVFPGRDYSPLLHVHKLPHRIMSLEVAAVYRRWTEAQHPLCEFMFETDHLDIDLG